MRYYLFCRLWPGFTDPFPFDQFNSLDESEIEESLREWAKDQYRSNLSEIRSTRRNRWDDYIERLKRQSAQRLGGGGSRRSSEEHGEPRRLLSPRAWRRIAIGVEGCPTLVHRVGNYLGFVDGQGGLYDTDNRGKSVFAGSCSPRIFFARAEGRGQANFLIESLRGKWGNINSNELTWANVKFGYIECDKLTQHDEASISTKMQRSLAGKGTLGVAICGIVEDAEFAIRGWIDTSQYYTPEQPQGETAEPLDEEPTGGQVVTQGRPSKWQKLTEIGAALYAELSDETNDSPSDEAIAKAYKPWHSKKLPQEQRTETLAEWPRLETGDRNEVISRRRGRMKDLARKLREQNHEIATGKSPAKVRLELINNSPL